MAGKKADKSADKPKKSGGIMTLLPKILGVLAIISATVLLAGLYDIGHFGPQAMLSSLAIIPLVFFALCAIAALFLGGKKGDPASADGEAFGAMIDELQSKTTSRLTALRHAMDAMVGRDYESVVQENKALKAELDAIHDAERSKIDNEVEQLRARNEELQNQIRQWAVQTVGEAVVGQKAEEMRAA